MHMESIFISKAIIQRKAHGKYNCYEISPILDNSAGCSEELTIA